MGLGCSLQARLVPSFSLNWGILGAAKKVAQESDERSTHADGGIEKNLVREKRQQISTCLDEQQ